MIMMIMSYDRNDARFLQTFNFSGIINNQYIYFATLIAITLLVIGIIPGLSLLYYEEWRLNERLLLEQFT